MLKKLRITQLSTKTGGTGASYEVSINPEQISHTREMKISEDDGTNTAGAVSQHQSYHNDTMSFDVYLDGTGHINNNSIGVDAQVKELLEIVSGYNGSDHKPWACIITYAGFEFKCHCQSAKTDYTLFDNTGTPLRAKVALSFKQWISNSERESRAKKSSPDLSHAKTIRFGDSLPAICKEIYGDYTYYLQVAEYNGLSNFRKLEVGQTVYFPPLSRL